MTKSRLFRFALLSTALGLFAGCAPTAENVDEIWESTSLALTDAQTEVAVDVALGTTDSSGLTVEAACEDGGSVSVGGEMSVGTFDSSVSAAFDLDATFHGCQSDGVTIDGHLVWALSAEVDEGATLGLSWEGNLTYSGKYAGTCDISLTASASAMGSAASASYEGTICGFDASETLAVSL
jgi:hypothetical protein